MKGSSLLVILLLTASTGFGVVAAPKFLSTPAPIVESRNPTLIRLQEMGFLVTQRMTFEMVVPVTQEHKIAELVGVQSKLLYIARASADIGIDLTKTSETTEGDDSTITLPSPQVLSVSIDPDQSRVYSVDQGFLNLGPDTKNFQSVAEKEVHRRIKEQSCLEHSRQSTQRQAVVILKSVAPHSNFIFSLDSRCEEFGNNK